MSDEEEDEQSTLAPWLCIADPLVMPLRATASAAAWAINGSHTLHPSSSSEAPAILDEDAEEPAPPAMDTYGVVVTYLIDNSQLRSNSPGLAYRNSKDINDKHREELAPWSTEVSGVDLGDDWVQVGKFYLPFKIGDSIVLTPRAYGYKTGQCVTCADLGRNPFYCFYHRAREGCSVTVNTEFESINTQRNTLRPGMRGVIIEVDADDDRRTQFDDFENSQWVAYNKVLFLTINPEGHSSSNPKDAGGDSAGEACEPLADSGDGRSIWSSFLSLIGQDYPREVTCTKGHPLAVIAYERNFCDVCGTTGTQYRCSVSCDWDICYPCYQKALGKSVTLDGKWVKGDHIEVIKGDKVIFAEGDVHDLKRLSNTLCTLTIEAEEGREEYTGELTADGMRLVWNDGDMWVRSLREEYLRFKPQVDVHSALRSLQAPACSSCGEATRWSDHMQGCYEKNGWVCSQVSSCGSKGSSNSFPWRWFCRRCSYDLCSHCGPTIPIPLETLRPQTVPIMEEWLTAGAKALMQDSGKYYHEVRLGRGLNSPHIGWLTSEFVEREFDGHGVGTDAHGWAADGVRHKKWHCGCLDARWPRDWQPGDVIGCAIDIECGQMSFSLNGSWVSTASLIFHAANRAFFPAVSMNGDFEMHVVQSSWRFQPPVDDYQAWADGGVYTRPQSLDMKAGDRICVQEACSSNSTEPKQLKKGQLGTVRYIDEDGDALIDFDGHAKGEWIFRTCFERLRILDLMRVLNKQETAAYFYRPFNKLASVGTWLTPVRGKELCIPDKKLNEAVTHEDNDLVGIWDFAGGTFDVEDRNGRLFFYNSELKLEEETGWMQTVLPKTGVSYRLRLNRYQGNVLVWQEMGKGGDEWEATHYATRRGRMSDGAQIMTTMQASIWASAQSGYELGMVPGGAALVLAGPRVQGDGLWMAPVRPRGAVELRCIRLDEHLDQEIEEVDTNDVGGGEEGQKYVAFDSIWEALEHGDTLLIKGSWCRDLAEKDEVPPRRQEVPDEGAWDPIELRRLVEQKRVQIVAVSYCWLSPEHPDPEGQQLKTIANIIDQRLEETTIPLDDLALFIDWCSLYQEPWDDIEEASFDRGFKSVNLWYAHAQTMVWLLTLVPDGVVPFNHRGWPTFERAVSAMLTESSKLLDLGKLDDTCNRWFQTCKVCTVQRAPPLVPDALTMELRNKIFTCEADRPAVEQKYEQTFHEVMASAKFLEFQALGWDPSQVACFAEALPYCFSLTKLTLTENEVGTAVEDTDAGGVAPVAPVAPMAVPPAIGNDDLVVDTADAEIEEAVEDTECAQDTGQPAVVACSEVKAPRPTDSETVSRRRDGEIDLADYPVARHTNGNSTSNGTNGDTSENTGLANVAIADSLLNPNVDEPVAAAALALHLPKVTKLRQILCRGCNIGDIDVAVIARALPHCLALVTLNLQDNKIGPKGTVALARVLPDCKRLGLLYLASNKIGEEGALALAEYAPRCDTLRELWVTDAGDMGDGRRHLVEIWREKGKAEGFLHL